MRLTITERVWRGVLLMWRNPKIIELMQADDRVKKLKKHKFQQQEIDCVLRAVDWAKGNEEKYRDE
jgi:Fe-S cluster assembly ATPase SufC